MNINFELILFYAVIISGVIGLFDMVFLAPRRRRLVSGEVKVPMLCDYARSFFPVLLIVFLLRSFLFEPFRIPSGSLEPTLLMGDFILVSKYNYGIRLPVIHKKILNTGELHRGDIVVLRSPPDPSIDFIKRVIGLPGDHVQYINKTLYINGQKIPQVFVKNAMAEGEEGADWQAVQNQEDLLGVKHSIYLNPERSSRDYTDIIVPKNMYFVMGDNRDDSADSRYWGFVPDQAIVGKAKIILFSWNGEKDTMRWTRFGRLIH